MAKFRKKPVVIEAFLWDNRMETEKPGWFGVALNKSTVSFGPNKTILIKTLEGTMTASFGDWIILGVKGEIYPCKSDIFEATYEEVK